jgi:alpha-ribazole phosphatase
MTRLWWVRHGPTHQAGMVGWRDVPADLSDTAALARLSDFLPQDAPVISSTLRRAMQTADAIADHRPRLPSDPDLREFDYGLWDGLHWTEIAEKWPDLSRSYWESPGDAAPPGGESWTAGSMRMTRATETIAGVHSGRDVIIVAHMGVILTQVQRALQVTAYQVLAQKIDNLSVTRLDWDGSRWHAPLINHIP